MAITQKSKYDATTEFGTEFSHTAPFQCKRKSVQRCFIVGEKESHCKEAVRKAPRTSCGWLEVPVVPITPLWNEKIWSSTGHQTP
jgi:hypothetical protein